MAALVLGLVLFLGVHSIRNVCARGTVRYRPVRLTFSLNALRKRCVQELQDNIEHPTRLRAQSGRLRAKHSRPVCSA